MSVWISHASIRSIRSTFFKGDTMQFSKTLKALAAVAIAFGLLTIFSGGRALFGSAEAQAAVGNAVPFVLWFNFMAGFGYVMAGVGLWLNRRWGFGAAVALAIATAGVAMAFYVHVHGGGAYEPRTVGALGLRLVFWSVVAGLAWRSWRPKSL